MASPLKIYTTVQPKVSKQKQHTLHWETNSTRPNLGRSGAMHKRDVEVEDGALTGYATGREKVPYVLATNYSKLEWDRNALTF